MKFPDNITIISDEVSQDLPVISAFVREFRLPGIELRSLNGRAFKDLTRSDIAEVITASRAEGWRVVGCATPVFKCDLDDTTAIAAHRDIFKRSLEVAHELNADLLRVFTFLRTPHPAEPAKQQRVIEHLHGLVALAAGSGIRLGVENEHSCLAATADGLLAIALSGVPCVARTKGSTDRAPGIGGGPSGLPIAAPLSVRSTVGLLAARALLPAPCNRPPVIHWRIVLISLSESLDFGGIAGSSVWVTDLNSWLLSGSPALRVVPLPPPLMALLNDDRSRSPLSLSGL
jgi:hypothetical protein